MALPPAATRWSIPARQYAPPPSPPAASCCGAQRRGCRLRRRRTGAAAPAACAGAAGADEAVDFRDLLGVAPGAAAPGSPRPGSDGPRARVAALVRACDTFVHDLRLPGMVHGRVLRPPGYRRRLAGLPAEAGPRHARGACRGGRRQLRRSGGGTRGTGDLRLRHCWPRAPAGTAPRTTCRPPTAAPRWHEPRPAPASSWSGAGRRKKPLRQPPAPPTRARFCCMPRWAPRPRRRGWIRAAASPSGRIPRARSNCAPRWPRRCSGSPPPSG